MILAGTPKSWPDGPDVSTLTTLLIFIGIPLLVFAAIYLLAYAPSWVKGPRYRPGQPWGTTSEWFGAQPGGHAGATAISSHGATGGAARSSAGAATAQALADPADGGVNPAQPGARPQTGLDPTPSSGGASAGW